MPIHPISCGLGNAFLIERDAGLFLVDSGSPGQQARVLAKMQAIGRRDLKLIWITHAHYDHYGSAAALRRLTGAKVGIHRLDAASLSVGQSPLALTRRYGFIYPPAQRALMRLKPLAPTPPDFILEDGESLERFGLDATVLHTPGHTPGHACLCLEGGVVFAGDLLGGFPRLALQNLLATDWAQLPASLDKLRSARPDWLYLGHRLSPVAGSALQAL